MALHAPAQHAGVSTHHWLRDILIIGVVAVLTIGGVWALSTVQPFTQTVTTSEAQQLIQFRAGERANWAGTATSEQDSLIQFRAGER